MDSIQRNHGFTAYLKFGSDIADAGEGYIPDTNIITSLKELTPGYERCIATFKKDLPRFLEEGREMQYVAYKEGELLGIDDDLDRLWTRVLESHGTPDLVSPIVDETRPIYLGAY